MAFGMEGFRTRFDTLDGLRGTAALLVLCYHFGADAPIMASAGYLAVDLFFGLSGFVLACAYEAKLRDGMSLGRFALLRLIRIYPMAALGAGIGVLLSGRNFASLLLLPAFGGLGALYPANVPLWSLAFELVVNVLFAACTLHVGRRSLAAIIFASAVAVTFGARQYGLHELGTFWLTAGYGLARTIFSFALGVAMHRLHQRFAIVDRETRLAWLVPAALAVLLTTVPVDHIAYDLFCVFLILPGLLWLGTIWHPTNGALMRKLGDISFPLYCIHGVIAQWFHATQVPLAHVWIVVVAAAWWLDSRVDRPLRRWLTARLAGALERPPGNAREPLPAVTP
jgi:peptidoglycan/LPS O-acetylase OafA/YrhL